METVTTKGNKQEFYTVRPNLKQFVGIKVNKDSVIDEEICEGVRQTLKDLVLTTYIDKETKYDKISTKEKTELAITLEEGMILIYQENEGYVIPGAQVCPIEEVIEQAQEIINVYKNLTIEE